MPEKKKEKSGLEKLAEMLGGLTGIAVKSKQERDKRIKDEIKKGSGK